MQVKLPIIKEHVSYSEIFVWTECSEKHKLKYINGIALDGPSEHTEFGHLIHSALEQYLRTRILPNIETLKNKLNVSFKEMNKLDLDPKQWSDTIEPILNESVLFLNSEFLDWEFVAAEQELNEVIENQQKRFKGYIDGIIKVKKQPRKNAACHQEPIEEEYWIIDYKTTSYGWTADKKTDPKKTMQLAFYKHFWSVKLGIPITSIKCGFLLLKRTAKNGSRCELVTVPIGEKAIEKAMEVLTTMLQAVKKKLYIKNRESCRFCPYSGTEHCSG